MTSAPRPLALARKDLRLARRRTPARSAAMPPIVFAAASIACWAWAGPGADPAAREWVRFAAFGLGLLSAAMLAEWLVVLAGLDPFPVLHVLPIGPLQVWAGRALWVAAWVAVLLASQAAVARALEPAALGVHLVWLGIAVTAVGLLGVHYGITLGSHPDAARRFLTLMLAIAMAASLMIPLLGWVVLLAAVIHSGRRVPRWHVQESGS